MFDNTFHARHLIESWSAVLGKLPKPVADAANVFHEAEYAIPAQPVFDPAGVTLENVGAAIDRLAADLAGGEHHQRAVRQAREVLARRVLGIAEQEVDTIIDGLTPGFEEAVDNYRSSVAELPDRITSDGLVAARDTTAYGFYTKAVDAAAAISAVDNFLATLTYLPKYFVAAPVATSSVDRVLVPANREELKLLLSVRSSKDATVAALNPIYLAAVRAGIEWGLSTPDVSRARRKEIDSTPVVRKKLQFAKVTR
jgi:hypothetical protein